MVREGKTSQMANVVQLLAICNILRVCDYILRLTKNLKIVCVRCKVLV